MIKVNPDVVIIGGGIMGCSLAYYLSKKNAKVILVEKSGIAAGASGRAYGMAWVSTGTEGLNLEIRKLSQKIYSTLSEELSFDIEFRNNGSLTVALGEKIVKQLWEFAAEQRSLGLNIISLDAKETRYLEPLLNPEIAGSVFCSEDNTVNPMLVTTAFAMAAQRLGTKIYTGNEVERIIVKNNAVEGIETKELKVGSRIVVNAAGSWGGWIGKMAGIEVPVFPQRLQTLVTGCDDLSIRSFLLGAHEVGGEEEKDIIRWASGFLTEEAAKKKKPELEFYVLPTTHNNFIIGSLSNFLGFDTSTTHEGISVIANNAKRYVPSMGRLRVIRSYAGLLPYSSDTWPFLGFIEQLEGFVLCCGHYMGISHGPGTGFLLSQLIINGKAEIPLDEYRYGRL